MRLSPFCMMHMERSQEVPHRKVPAARPADALEHMRPHRRAFSEYRQHIGLGSGAGDAQTTPNTNMCLGLWSGDGCANHAKH
jgi:hypothetical protein